MASWHHGIMASWHHGIMASCHHGIMSRPSRKLSSQIVAVLAGVFLAVTTGTLQAQPLNPSFEDTTPPVPPDTISGWKTIVTPSVPAVSQNVQLGNISNFPGPKDGNSFVYFQVSSNPGVFPGRVYKSNVLKSSPFNGIPGTEVSFFWYVRVGIGTVACVPNAKLYDETTGLELNEFLGTSFSTDSLAWKLETYRIASNGTFNLQFNGGLSLVAGPTSTNSFLIDNITVTPPGIKATSATLNVTEGGASATYTLALNTAPTANVTVTINPGAQLTASPATLTFTPTDWSNPKPVSVKAIDDALANGFRAATIANTATSMDAAYNSVSTNRGQHYGQRCVAGQR